MDAVAKKIEIREVSQRKTAYLFIKRVFDIVLSLVLFVVLLPLLLQFLRPWNDRKDKVEAAAVRALRALQ